MNSVIDFANIEEKFRHAIFFSMFEGLQEGKSFEFLNDQDPVPLLEQLSVMEIPNLEWKYSEQGPLLWRVRITKMTTSKKKAGCCGICGGHD